MTYVPGKLPVVKKCLLKSVKFSFKRDVSGITPSSDLANITAVKPETNVSEYTCVLFEKLAREREFK